MRNSIARCLIGLILLGFALNFSALTARAAGTAPGQLQRIAPPQAAAWTLTLDISKSAPGFYLAEARLHDAAGQPVAGAPIAFYEKTTFGRLLLDTVKTDKQGYASSEAKIPNRTLNLIATYCESPQSCGVETTGQLQVDVKPSGVPFSSRPADLSTPYAPPVPVALMLLTLTGLWSAFAFVAYQVYRIRRPLAKPFQRR